MATSLATESEAIRFIRERFQSRMWWVIVGASPDGITIAQIIEEKFYSGDNAQFFDMIVVPAMNEAMPPISAVFFARKQEMSPVQLSEVLQSVASELPDIDGSYDVLLTPDVPASFFEWLECAMG